MGKSLIKIKKSIQKRLSIVINGPYREETNKVIDFFLRNFSNSDIIFSTNNLKKTTKNYLKKKIRVFSNNNPPPPLNDFGVLNSNIIRQSYSALTGIKAARNNYVIRIRSDLIPNQNFLKNFNKNFEKFNRSSVVNWTWFDQKIVSKKIFCFPKIISPRKFGYGDMFHFSTKETLINFFYPTSSNKNIGLRDLGALPNPRAQNRELYINTEELVVSKYFQSIYNLETKNNIWLDDVIFSKNLSMFSKKVFMFFDENSFILPKRINKHLNSFKGKLLKKLTKVDLIDKIYTYVYNNFVNKIN